MSEDLAQHHHSKKARWGWTGAAVLAIVVGIGVLTRGGRKLVGKDKD